MLATDPTPGLLGEDGSAFIAALAVIVDTRVLVADGEPTTTYSNATRVGIAIASKAVVILRDELRSGCAMNANAMTAITIVSIQNMPDILRVPRTTVRSAAECPTVKK